MLTLTCDHPILNFYSDGKQLICRPCERANVWAEVFDLQCATCGETVDYDVKSSDEYRDRRCQRCGSTSVYRDNPGRVRLRTETLKVTD